MRLELAVTLLAASSVASQSMGTNFNNQAGQAGTIGTTPLTMPKPDLYTALVLLAQSGLEPGVGEVQSGNIGSAAGDDYTALVQVNIRCVNDQFNGLVCAAEYPDKCSEQWNFPNPCTQANIDANITKFVHPFDKTKFLMCGELGKLYVVQCPQFEIFHEGCGQCVGEAAGMSASCEVPLPPVVGNPCTREAILANKLFFPFPRNLSMFIHCDIWGKPWERICTPGEVWSIWDNTCVLPHLLNPCNRPTTDLNYFYRHPCNPRVYLQCDLQGLSHEVTCPANTAFNSASQQCQSLQTFPQNYDVTPFCESYIFAFRQIHGNDGVPLTNESGVVDQGLGLSGITDVQNAASQVLGGGTGSQTTWQAADASAWQSGVNIPSPSGTSSNAFNGATNWQDVRSSAGTGQTTNWQSTGSQTTGAGASATTSFTDIRTAAQDPPPIPGVQSWNDVSSSTGNAGFSVANGKSANGVGLTGWQDVSSQTNAWQDVGNQANTGGVGGNLPTLDLRNQLGLGTDQVATTKNTGVVNGGGGQSVTGGTGQSGGTGQVGGDKTMQQLLNTWNRIISSGGTAAANGGGKSVNNFGGNAAKSNNLGNTVNGVGVLGPTQGNGINQMQRGKPLHPSQTKMYEFSVIPFSEPCTQENLDQGRTHFRLKGDPHKFLQCGVNGKMHKMPCSTVGRDWFDVYTNTCVDGPVHLPV